MRVQPQVVAESLHHDDHPRMQRGTGGQRVLCTGSQVEGGELSTSCARGALEAYRAKDFKATKTMAGRTCNKTLSAGCGLLGVLHAKGEGVPQDLKRGGRFTRAMVRE